MRTYAQTIHQLYQQLRTDTWSDAELIAVKVAHDVASDLFAGRMQSSGKPLLCHCVGTASILAAHGAPREVVAAGLLHNVYAAGDFGDGRKGATARRRHEMQSRVGRDIEQYLHGFARFRWKRTEFAQICAAIRPSDAFQRHVVLLRLADECEHLVDAGLLYRPNSRLRLQELVDGSALLLEIAKRIDNEQIGLELSELIQTAAVTPAMGDLATESTLLFGTVVVPRSYRKRFMLRVRNRLRRALGRRRG
jgi:(p)ppGpp synthase/HD superfamily hydrolase